MAPREDPGAPPGARELTALFAPLRFAARQEGAALERLAGLGKTVRGAIQLARKAGAPESPALARLAGEADAFDRRPVPERLAAVCRIAAELGSLVPLPPDLGEIARRGRIPAPARAKAGSPRRPTVPEARSGRSARPASRGPRPGRATQAARHPALRGSRSPPGAARPARGARADDGGGGARVLAQGLAGPDPREAGVGAAGRRARHRGGEGRLGAPAADAQRQAHAQGGHHRRPGAPGAGLLQPSALAPQAVPGRRDHPRLRGGHRGVRRRPADDPAGGREGARGGFRQLRAHRPRLCRPGGPPAPGAAKAHEAAGGRVGAARGRRPAAGRSATAATSSSARARSPRPTSRPREPTSTRPRRGPRSPSGAWSSRSSSSCSWRSP